MPDAQGPAAPACAILVFDFGYSLVIDLLRWLDIYTLPLLFVYWVDLLI